MPYVIVSGNLNPNKNGVAGQPPIPPGWRVGISGLKACDLEDLKRFTYEQGSDVHTVSFRHHPVVLLNALEVLGYRVISSFHVNPDSCVWTMRKDFPEPCPEPSDEEESDSAPEID
ncbi:uncharacterized protein LOC124208045 isoform X2 [Daphnia pulex]|uniref:GTP cyclohydrolase 1 feedback regulatory protein n=1 Tax=Daphnia pulex TaxID=6669 RepID=E9GIM5_DAPPU|nr:uncharacterized protein LOC124208045 isoform X2 [Daphnia pulex]EFX80683.1 hypothetical protein DAPPUDRAFT_318384 [Daphnia pulex]|eukprot:EFX80683.1 hypothetical protein DAPPUDRAFT_318384 [Daphnia pulex]